MSIGELVREVRNDAGFSVRNLARAAGVSPSTVHRIEKGKMEPTIEMLNQLFSAAGSRLDLAIDTDSAINIVGLSRSFRADINRGDDSSLIRKAAEFGNRFWTSSRKSQKKMIGTRPPSTSSKKWDAFIGALGEWLAVEVKIPVPLWTREDSRFLELGWWVTPMESLRAWEYAGSPAAFQTRGVYIHRESLKNL